MAAKLALSRIKGKPTSSTALSFRFVRSEDDLEEVTVDEQNTEKQDEMTSIVRPSNTYPTSLEKVATEVSSIPHSLSTDSKDILRESFSDVPSPCDEVTEGLSLFPGSGLEPDKYSASLPSEPFKQSSESTHNVRVKDVRDSSPMKESVKDYLAKLSKRSSSLENSPATENDNWSLFNEWKGRLTKTLEEKISREPSISSKSVERPNIQPSSQKIIQPSYPVEISSSDKEDSLNYYANTLSSPSCAVSERKLPSADSTDSDRKSMSSEDQLPLYIENDIKSITSFDDDTEDNTDIGKCIILNSSSGQRKTSASTTGTQSLISPKRGSSNMSVTLSSLMAAKVLDSDSMEEIPSELNTPDAENLGTPKDRPITDQIILTAPDDTVEDSEVKTKSHPITDNKFKTLSKNKLLVEIQQACRNLKSCWQKQVLAFAVAFVACVFVPLPPFLSGFLSGILLTAIAGWLLWQLFQPLATKEPLLFPDYANLPPLAIPKSDEQSTDIFKGWMNQLLYEYDPETYHVSNTKSVYIRLDGTSLRLSHPKNNIPKRAMWNESRYEPVFISQRHYNLAGATISLLPEGLARKRLWSKKYPIYLEVLDSPNQFHQGDNDSFKAPSQRNSFGSTGSLVDSQSDSDEMEMTSKPNTSAAIKLYLFARTSRDKEEWYWLLCHAAKQKTNWLKSSLSSSNQNSQIQPTLKDQRSFSMDLGSLNTSSYGDGSILLDLPSKESEKLDFNKYMAPFFDSEVWLKNFSCFPNIPYLKDKKLLLPELKNNVTSKENMLWLNALIGRIFFNFLTEECWWDEVSNRIQKKLSKIRVPYFIQELKLKDINLGKALPQIQRASDPTMDNRGLWIDLDITYNGSFQMTLETKLNLLRLKKGQGVEMDEMPGITGDKCFVDKSGRSYLQNSEEEDSAESSSDDEMCPSEIPEHGNLIKASVSQHISSSGTSRSKKLLRIVDKIAQSRYFQQATEFKYVKKYMEEVSNTPLLLTVEVNGLIGTLALNIPPLPTDRLWYGFRKNPQLSISARPKLGERQVTLAPVTDWIEKKLALEFQKILVMPNMDDLIIPVMTTNVPSSRT